MGCSSSYDSPFCGCLTTGGIFECALSYLADFCCLSESGSMVAESIEDNMGAELIEKCILVESTEDSMGAEPIEKCTLAESIGNSIIKWNEYLFNYYSFQ